MSNSNFDEYLEKSLPSNEEAEEVCLGSVFLDNEVMDSLMDHLDPRDFYSPIRKVIYHAMQVLHSAGSEIDPILVGEELKKEGKTLESIGGVTTITALTHGLPHFQNVDKYIKIVKDHSIARDAIRLFNARTRDILAGDTDIQEVLDKAEHRIMQLNNSASGDDKRIITGFTDVRDIAGSIREQFERYNRGETTGVKTGMEPLDLLLDGGGLQGKATYLIAGAEKSGKTSMALEWVRDIVINQGFTVPVVTLEMSKETMFKRLYSMHTGIPYYMFRPGFYDGTADKPYTRAIEGLAKFGEYNFKIADGLFDMSQIMRWCARLVEEGRREGNTPVGAIVLDYLQLIRYDLEPTHSREREVAGISRAIKVLSADLDVPVIVLSNMNRIGMVEGQEPDTYNLRDSGSLAYDAEAVMFVHNPNYKPGKPYESREVTDMVLILSRQRNGPTGRIPLKFIGPYMSFMTEKQYLKHFGNSKVDQNVPQSKGSLAEQDERTENLWDVDDDEWMSNGGDK